MTRFAADDDEAYQRYLTYQDLDPFPKVQASLLNIADVIDYVAQTGMIFPFVEDYSVCKPASYGLPLQGRCKYWDEKSGPHDFILSETPLSEYSGPEYSHVKYRGELELCSNSIAFVSLGPMFRLPSYIAMRFNLAIREVYRGLLLGTGPLVDPGFEGKLSFPLHNLTNETYKFRAGEKVVWAEFTKISPHKSWVPGKGFSPKIPQEAKFYRFPEEKTGRERRDVVAYLHHANFNKPIVSSIPLETKNATEAARAAQRTVEWWSRISIIAGLSAILGGVALVYGGYQVVVGTLQVIDAARKDMTALSETNVTMKETLKNLGDANGTLKDALKQSQSDISKLEADLADRAKQLDDRAAARAKAIEDRLSTIETAVAGGQPASPRQ